MPAFIDLTGKRFGRLVVQRRGLDTKGRQPRWHCLCDCGNQSLSNGQSLRNGTATSCGCYNKEINAEMCRDRAKHNMAHTKVWCVWRTMKQRCYLKTNRQYKDYGGRGITYCPEWEQFENFYRDMGPRPTPKHTLERIDSNGNYEPSNCRWASMQEQQNNRRNNRHITFNGKTQTVMQWSRETGISRNSIENRLDNLNWSVERALTEPVQPGRRPK